MCQIHIFIISHNFTGTSTCWFSANHIQVNISPRDIQTKMADIEKWIEIAKECKYLPENDLKVIK